MKDIGTSILARLKNKAKAGNTSYQQLLQLFFQEEFLRRLAKSRYINNLILNGGLLIYTLSNFTSRATVDVDFLLRRIDNSLENMEGVIAEILSVPTELSDVVIFRAQKPEPIAVQRKYHGFVPDGSKCKFAGGGLPVLRGGKCFPAEGFLHRGKSSPTGL
jgi:hypothetical protein